ncbi:Voltage-gated Ion Channel (VIC) Superfamily [Achlya hypogyna]|uniref:Voltage-gated Ion Channel (VIC) Superfamily n=1 Tax=Achlya hypogyna TaxID=1202772 RepID=A0A1V9ZR29_ACHHY|nr:Voltage-gated Ion Channel (VIC) Superfamily [Achlya hypogyna]
MWGDVRGYLRRKVNELRYGRRKAPRRRVHKVIARRQYAHVREFVYVVCYNLQLVAHLFFVPLRLGFVFDPYLSAHSTATPDDLLFFAVDVCTELFGVVNFFYLARYHRGLYNRPVSLSQHSSHSTTSRPPTRMANTVRRASISERPRSDAPVTLRQLHFMGTVSGRSLTRVPRAKFLLECGALIPFEFVLYAAFGVNGLHLARLPKLLRLHNGRRCLAALKTVLSRHAVFARLNNTPVSFLVALALLHLSVFHVVSAAYMLLAHVECGVHLDACTGGHGRRLSGGASVAAGTATCWAVQAQLHVVDIWDQYVRTLLIVAFGDAIAYTYAEACFGIVIQLLRALISCALIGAFELVFRHYNSRRSTYVALLEDARTYSLSRQLPENLRKKILGYFDYFWRVQLGILENNVVSSMPAHFQAQCTHVLKASLISKVHFLSKEGNNIIQNLAALLTSQVFMPMDWITKTTHLREMYLISRGKVFLVDDNQHIVSKLSAGDTFGEISLFTDHGFAFKALAETFCELYQLHTDVFHTVIDAYYSDGAVAAARKAEWKEAIETRDHQMLKTQKLLNQGETLQSVMKHQYSKSARWVLPHSRFRIAWSMLHLGSLVYMAVEIPYKLIFTISQSITFSATGTVVFASSVLNETFHVLHIIFLARYFAFIDTSSIATTAPVTDPDLIFAHYKESNEWRWDLLAIVPVSLAADILPAEWGAYVLWLRTFRLVRLVRLRQLHTVLEGVLEDLRVSSAMQTVTYLSLGVLLVTHVAGCLWFFIADIQTPNALAEARHWAAAELTRARCEHDGAVFANCTWFLYDTVHHPHNSEYARALFWSVMTLTTVGYGAIYPFTTAECMYAFAWFYVSCLINFGVIGAISSAIAQMMANENRSQDRLLLINRFMKYREVSPVVQHQVRRYYKNQWLREKGVNEEAFLCVLPDNLQHEILTFLHSQTFEHIAIFDGVSDECKQIIASIIRHETYQAGDVIAHEGDMGADLYIVRSGTVEVFEAHTPIQVLHAGSCFGEANFVLELPYAMSIRAMTPTELSVLRRNEFEQIIKFYPEEWAVIYEQGLEVHASVDAAWSTIKANLGLAKIVNFAQSTTSLFVTPPRDGGAVPPTNALRKVWEVVVASWSVYNGAQIVFRIAFLHEPSDTTHVVLATLDYLCDAFFAVDIYLKYNHFTYDTDGAGILSRAESRVWYRRHGLWLDLVASAPTYYIGGAFGMTLCRLPRLLRCLELPTLIDALQLALQERFVSARVTAVLRLTKLLVILTVFAHYTGAFFYLIGNPSGVLHSEDETTEEHAVLEWYLEDPVIEAHHGNALVVYLRAFYWALTTVTAMDYRDIHPLTNAETYYTCVACFAGFFFVGQVIGRLTSIIVNMDKEANEFVLRIDNFNEYGRAQKLPKFLLERGHHYFEFQFECTRGMEADVIFADLPHSLRLKLYYDLYGKRLREIPLFYAFDTATLAAIAERLFPVLFLPHDNILVEGGTGVSLFIMNQGRAEHYVRACNLVVAAVPEGGLFGEVAFFLPETTHLTSVRASTCCEVFRLERVDWIALWPDGRRAELEGAMEPVLLAKREYLEVAVANILTNLTFVDGISTPKPKVRKHMVANNLRRASTYGQRRFNIMRMTMPNTLRFQLSGREAVSPRVLPVPEPEVDTGPHDAVRRRTSLRERSMSLINDKIAAVRATNTMRRKLRAEQRKREQRAAVILRSLTREADEMDELDEFAEGDLDVDDDEDVAQEESMVMRRSSWIASRDKLLEADVSVDTTPRIEELIEETRLSSGHFDHLDVLRRASLRLQNPKKTYEVTRVSIWADAKMPPWWTHPHSTFRAAWDQLLFAIVVYYSLSVPFRACFFQASLYDHAPTSLFFVWFGVEYVLDVVCLVDVAFRWTVFCRMVRGELVTDVAVLRAEYRAKDGWAYDVFAALPLEALAAVLPSGLPTVHLMSLLRFNKMARLVHVPSYSSNLRELLTLRFKSVSWLGSFLSFLDIWAIFLLCAHWIACVWFYVGLRDPSTMAALLNVPSVQVTHGVVTDVGQLQAAYLQTFYFASTTLTSVAFGNAYCTTLDQNVATMLMIFVGLLAYGVLTGGFSEIFEEEFKNLVKFEDHIGVVSTFLVHRQFPRHVVLQIMEYFRMLWERSEGIVENQALAPLSSALREDIAVYVKRDLITKVKLFSECDQDFTRAIVAVLQAEFYVAKDVIIREGDYERSMYFIHMGFILVTNNARSYEVVKQKGDYFGERSLLHNTPRSATCSAISNCEMYILEHAAYEYTLERFPDYRERNLRSWGNPSAAAHHSQASTPRSDNADNVPALPLPETAPSTDANASLQLSSPTPADLLEIDYDPTEKIRRLSSISQLHSFYRRPLHHEGTSMTPLSRSPSSKKLLHTSSQLDVVAEGNPLRRSPSRNRLVQADVSADGWDSTSRNELETSSVEAVASGGLAHSQARRVVHQLRRTRTDPHIKGHAPNHPWQLRRACTESFVVRK